MSVAAEIASTMLSRRFSWVTLLVVALMVLCARLSVWQFDRLEQRRGANAALLESVNAAPLDLNNPADIMAAAGTMENRTVIASGQFDSERQMMLKLQTVDGRPGVNLITPLQLDGTDRIVLVDRGWIPDAAVENGEWGSFVPQSPTTVSGYLTPSDTPVRETVVTQGPTGPLREIYRVDLAVLDDEFGDALLPFYIREAPVDGALNEQPLRREREVDLTEGPHLGYAIQWIIFALGLGVAYIVFIYRQAAFSENE